MIDELITNSDNDRKSNLKRQIKGTMRFYPKYKVSFVSLRFIVYRDQSGKLKEIRQNIGNELK